MKSGHTLSLYNSGDLRRSGQNFCGRCGLTGRGGQRQERVCFGGPLSPLRPHCPQIFCPLRPKLLELFRDFAELFVGLGDGAFEFFDQLARSSFGKLRVG